MTIHSNSKQINCPDYGDFSPQRYSDTNFASPKSPNVSAFTGAEFFRKQGHGYSGYYGIYYFSHGTGNPILTFTTGAASSVLEWARYSGGTNSGDSSDEYWALDNVVVSTIAGSSAVPEPSGVVIAGLGFLGLIVSNWRKTKPRQIAAKR